MPSTPPSMPDDSVDPSDDLQYELAEPATVETVSKPVIATRVRTTGPATACAGCGRPITDTYFALGDKTVCPACRASIDVRPTGSRLGRFAKATLLGTAGGLLGAAVWFAIRHFANMEIGYVALLVGFLVGKAVRKGSGGRGGRRYQVLAVVLTYCCIAANYMPDVGGALLDKYHKDHPTVSSNSTPSDPTPNKAMPGAKPHTGPFSNAPTTVKPAHVNKPVMVLKLIGLVALLVAIIFAMSLAAPFFAGASNLLGLLIIGIALYEAWKLTAGRRLAFTGPYRLAPAAA